VESSSGLDLSTSVHRVVELRRLRSYRAAEFAVSGKYAMVPQPVKARRGHRRAQARYQIKGLEDEGAGSITPRALECQLDAAILQTLEALLRQSWPGNVAHQPFHPLSVTTINDDLCVQVDTPNFSHGLVWQIAWSLLGGVAGDHQPQCRLPSAVASERDALSSGSIAGRQSW
jgi:hypothetical protein